MGFQCSQHLAYIFAYFAPPVLIPCMKFLLVIGAFVAFFLTWLLSIKKDHSRADAALLVLFLVNGITLLLGFLEIVNRKAIYPFAIIILTSVPLISLHGPLMWLRLHRHSEALKQYFGQKLHTNLKLTPAQPARAVGITPMSFFATQPAHGYDFFRICQSLACGRI